MSTQLSVLRTLHECLVANDHQGMAACYHLDATFRDIAFDLRGKKQIHAMRYMIAEKSDLRATYKILDENAQSGSVEVIGDYTFNDTGRPVHNVITSMFKIRDGLIIEHIDNCSAFKWSMQALGPAKGIFSWLKPSTRRNSAMKRVKDFAATKPELTGAFD